MLQNRFLQTKCLRQFIRKLSAVQPKEKDDKMCAWQVHSYGEDLQQSRARIPIIHNPSDVLIAVKAASLNPIDVAMKAGYGRNMMKVLQCEELVLPLTLGRDFCGTVVDKGQCVKNNFNIGDTVYGVVPFNKQGSHADYVTVNKDHICHKPSNVNHLEAASIPYAALTAWSALWLTGGLKYRRISRMKILILGASGGVGTYAVQLLKSHCATVIATCALDAAPLVQSLGADCVLDYRDPNYYQNVASQGKYDIILDCAQFGYKSVPSNWDYSSFITLNSPLLHNTDNYGLIGGFVYSVAELIPTNLLNMKQGRLLKWAYFYPSKEALKLTDKLIRNGQMHPVIDTVFPFSQTPEAYKKAKGGHLRGKVVIDMDAKKK